MPAILPPSGPQGEFHPLDTHQQLTAGSDAKQADGTGLSWYSASWPNLAGAKLSMTVAHDEFNLFNLPVTWTTEVPALPPSPSAVHLDVPGSASANLPEGQYDYQLDATLTNGDTITLAAGHLSVSATPGSIPLSPPSI